VAEGRDNLQKRRSERADACGGRNRSPDPLWYHLEKIEARKLQKIQDKGATIIESIGTKVRYAKEGEVCVCVCAKSECMDWKTKERESEEAGGPPKRICMKSRRSKLCEVE